MVKLCKGIQLFGGTFKKEISINIFLFLIQFQHIFLKYLNESLHSIQYKVDVSPSFVAEITSQCTKKQIMP